MLSRRVHPGGRHPTCAPRRLGARPVRGAVLLLAMLAWLLLPLPAVQARSPEKPPEGAPLMEPSREPSIRWDLAWKDTENPRTGDYCGTTSESCRACPAGMARGIYRTGTGASDRYYAFCCAAGSQPFVQRVSGIGAIGVCLRCLEGCMKGEPRTEEGRRHGFDCFWCNGPGYSWRLHRGHGVCLSCGEGYVYSERTGLCHRDTGPHPRVPR